MKGDAEHKQTLRSYYTLLKENKHFRTIWIGEVVNNCGAWFNYVALLAVIERLAGERGLLVSLVVIIRLLPSLLLFPITGVIADRYSRELILVWSNVFAAVIVACFTLIRRSSDVWLLYVLLFLQCSASSFYDPARRAITPTIVSAHDLPLATTLDSFAWSLIGALGASTGGFAVSHLGAYSCFLLDAVTYLLAAWCALSLKSMLARAEPGAVHAEADRAPEALPLKDGPRDIELVLQMPQACPRAHALKSIHLMEGHFLSSLDAGREPAAEPAEGRAGARSGPDAEPAGAGESEGLIHARHGEAGAGKGAGGGREDGDQVPAGCWAAMLWQFRGELQDLREGLAYICAPHNRDAAAFVMIKASGAMVWGGADILQVRFSNLPSMHSLGDGATTLGLLFACVGLGCFIGPLLSNAVTPPRRHYLLRACAASFLSFLAGYLLMAAAPNIWLLLPATVVRSCGSSVVWVYSTLLIQQRIPNALQGRAMALEMAVYVVAECAGAIFGGVAFDGFHLGVRALVLIMAGVAAATSVAWIAYAWSQWPQHSAAVDEQEHQPHAEDEEDLLPLVIVKN